ncbi:DUF6600 domain-containing protein [Chryseobacterium sp. MDT2-18]|uniref:DUF6600 domain-containing protein n=1 Tax=Chryseobacterium sp. MDT2-18 TaxID=1259136 RepID=UPI00278B415B|nr:DUF6600 domain-containing protein [Chryseobacterium sp. MDT2-18]MDQ0477844.1 hypothetical protein [Chryseobacterium sp. MDT2-18]
MKTKNTSASTLKKLFKTVFTFALFIAIYANFGMTCVSAQSRISATITYQTFYDELSPYGHWIEYSGYEHVWSPNVDGDFRPYLTNGSWEYTTDGWAWVSNYDWGWAPFHYGRWLYDPLYGWLWIPGYEWSPAWVTWGEVDDYYAWAPLGPLVNVGLAYYNWRPNAFYWNIVRRNHIYDRDVSRFAEDRSRDNTFVNRIHTLNNFNRTFIHNQYYSHGPELKNVEEYTSRRITPVSIKSAAKIIPAKREGNNLHLYRPAVVHPQPPVFRRMNIDNAPMRTGEENFRQQNNNNRNSQLIENNRQDQNREARKTRSLEKAPRNQNMEVRTSPLLERRRQIYNTEEQRMPPVDRATQRQNIERMPEMRSPARSFESRMPQGSGRRR